MKKRLSSITALFLLLLMLGSLAGCGNTNEDLETDGDLTAGDLAEDLTYIPCESEELGILLKLPLTWEDNYEISYQKRNDQLVISTASGGILAQIGRQAGELIDDIEEIVIGPPAGLLSAANGWTYYYTLPGDVQYDPSNDEEAEQYEVMAADLDDIFASIVYLSEAEPPQAKTEGFKVAGTNYFTVEIIEEWELSNSREDYKWQLLTEAGSEIGYFKQVPYAAGNSGSMQTEVDGKEAWVKFYSDDNAQRTISLVLFLKQNAAGIGNSMLDTFQFTGGAFNYIDLETNSYLYQSGGAEKVTAQILTVDENEDGDTIITIEELDENMELTDVRRRLSVDTGATIASARNARAEFNSGRDFYDDYRRKAYDTDIFEITYEDDEVLVMIGVTMK